jgi:hypothetical protein
VVDGYTLVSVAACRLKKRVLRQQRKRVDPMPSRITSATCFTAGMPVISHRPRSARGPEQLKEEEGHVHARCNPGKSCALQLCDRPAKTGKLSTRPRM